MQVKRKKVEERKKEEERREEYKVSRKLRLGNYHNFSLFILLFLLVNVGFKVGFDCYLVVLLN